MDGRCLLPSKTKQQKFSKEGKKDGAAGVIGNMELTYFHLTH